MHRHSKYKIKCLTIALGAVVLCFCTGCTKTESEAPVKQIDRTKLPRMYAENVTTLISDSGITRYRIITPAWYIYDRATEPYWAFPKGIHLQRFDQSFHVDAEINCKKAYYFQVKQLWRLDGKVRMINIQGDMFESEQIFWSQRDQKIYSDSLIKVTQHTKIITGIGFESNQTLTQYTIKQPKGIIPVSPAM
ncbi:MAG: lptC [Bacteroidetes bacterium]|jgi:LPS export ABC transporter protein LptC|nr:lptC [Bacteroidota bacterium]